MNENMKNNSKNSVWKQIIAVLFAAVMIASVLPIMQVVEASGIPPEVVCVPFHGEHLNVPHDAWIGKEITLKGTAHDKDGDGTMVAYKWDFGDGYSTGWILGVDPYEIEAKHTYTGVMVDGTPYDVGKYFTAWLYVEDADGLIGGDSYFIEIRDMTLEVEVNLVIDDGLWWLHKQQTRFEEDNVDRGYWSDSGGGYRIAYTGAVIQAFENQGHLPTGDVGQNPYVETVQRGLNFIFSTAGPVSIFDQPAGDPDTNDNGIGIAFHEGPELYVEGIAMMAVVGSTSPDAVAATGAPDMVTYRDLVQDMVDYCTWAQNDVVPDADQGIFMHELPTGTQTMVSDDLALSLAISENWIVWTELQSDEIHIYDLITGIETPTHIWGANIAISSEKIVYSKGNGNGDIYMYDLATGNEMPICVDPARQDHPAISGEKIVWVDWRNGNGDIYMYDLATGSETPICVNLAEQDAVAIAGDTVVWQDLRNGNWEDGNWDIYMYDLATSVESVICEDPALQFYPAISGDRIVWADWRSGEEDINLDIYMYDLATGSETPICEDPALQFFPAISGDRVVWQDLRNGNWEDGNYDIYMYDIASGTETPICDDPFGQQVPDISGDRIVWAVMLGDPNRRGGWRYSPNHLDSDNSVTQWPIIGLEAAESWGLFAPDFVKSELDIWLTYSQCKEPGWSYGGYGYTAPCDWVNIGKTAGSGLCGFAYMDVPLSDQRVVDAINFIDNAWEDDGEHMGSYYAMYAVMKASRISDPQIESYGAHNWYEEYARYIVDDQEVDGSWTDELEWSEQQLASAWAILILTPTVYLPGPVADAGSDVEGHPPIISVLFDASGSYHRDPARSIVLYEWDFESDGTWDYSSPDPMAEHPYPAMYNPDGSINWIETTAEYEVTLRVTDDNDPPLTDTDTCLVSITAPPWKPVADANGPYGGYKNEFIVLDGSGSYDPEGEMYEPGHPWYETIATYEWDLDGDGLFDDSTEISPSWIWENKGTYGVALKVTDSQPSGPGGEYGELDMDMDYATVVIYNRPPSADANGPYYLDIDRMVNFDGSASSDPDGDALYYRWDFESDGVYDTSWSSSPYANHIYPEYEEYNVILEVTDNDDGYDTDTCRVVPTPPVIYVSIDIKPGSCPNPINWKGQVLPVAICGTEDFDVTTIDLDTIQLTRDGVEIYVDPIRWSYEDVATPYEGGECGCHDLDGDGIMDLTLKFKIQEVKDLLSDEDMGETIPLIIIGNLKDEDGGIPIKGQDCVLVIK